MKKLHKLSNYGCPERGSFLHNNELLLTDKRPLLTDKSLKTVNKRLLLDDKWPMLTNKESKTLNKEHLLADKRLLLANKGPMLGASILKSR